MREKRDVVFVPPPGAHGGDLMDIARALGRDPNDMIDLSVTMNPWAPRLDDLVRRHLSSVRHYPDVREATQTMAQVLEVEPTRVLLTNGGAEAIALVACYLGDATVRAPEFALWWRHLDTVRADDVSGEQRRVRSNPHSPLGTLAANDERALVWDEAFFPMTTGQWTRGDADRGAWVVGSLTKIFHCPGLRIGYVVAPSGEELSQLARNQSMWSVNSLAAAVVADLVPNAPIDAWSRDMRRARQELVEVFTSAGFKVRDGVAPWILVEAEHLREDLARAGVVVRDCTSFGLPGVVRVSVTSDDDLARVAGALNELSEVRE